MAWKLPGERFAGTFRLFFSRFSCYTLGKHRKGGISLELDLARVKSLFSNADYARGMEYFRQGRVLDMTAGEGEKPLVQCCVRGSEV